MSGAAAQRLLGLLVFACILVLAAIMPAVIGIVGSRDEPVTGEADQVANRPAAELADHYVSSRSCRACHPHEYDSWHDSYHRTMTQVAGPESVEGNFDVDMRLDGLNFHLEREDDRFFVTVPRDPGKKSPDDFRSEVVLTTGSHHMQVYWTSLHNSRALSLLPFAYLCEEKRWIPRRSAFLQPKPKTLSAEVGRWNESCMRCHTTHGRMRPGEMANLTHGSLETVDSHVAEFGISCEACHGPAEDHIAVNRDPFRRYKLHFDDEGDSTIVHPNRLPHDRASQVCGHCHGVTNFKDDEAWSKWAQHGYEFRPGDDLEKTALRDFVRLKTSPQPPSVQKHIDGFPHYLESMFWSDGMIRVSGREYNGLSRSPCFERGELSCMSCHQMHQPPDDPRPRKVWADDQLKLGHRGNQACIQCHKEYREESKLVAHTHHPVESSGSNCYNCHMPHTTYGLLKAIRSHQIDTPSVKNSLETRRPNACNQCHLDQTLEWTADYLADWHGHEKPDMSDDQREIAASVLWTLQGDAGQRALMAWSFGWEDAKEVSGSDWMAPYLGLLSTDRYDAVRLIAERSLKRLPGFSSFQLDTLGSEYAQNFPRVLQHWQSLPQKPPPERAARVLIDGQGQLPREKVEPLMKQRHDPDLHLLE